MKKMFENYAFVLSFTTIEVIIFVALYILHAFIFKGFSFPDSMIKGGYELFWRVMSLQIFIQILFIFIACKINYQRDIMILLGALLAFSIASVISFSDFSSVWRLMKLPTKETLGEGFAISVSVICTLIIYRNILK